MTWNGRPSTATSQTRLSGRWSDRHPDRRRLPPGVPVRDAFVNFRIPSSDKGQWEAAAQAAGLSLARWVMAQCQAGIAVAAARDELLRDAVAAQLNQARRTARARGRD
jgi:hypothetical protein